MSREGEVVGVATLSSCDRVQGPRGEDVGRRQLAQQFRPKLQDLGRIVECEPRLLEPHRLNHALARDD